MVMENNTLSESDIFLQHVTRNPAVNGTGNQNSNRIFNERANDSASNGTNVSHTATNEVREHILVIENHHENDDLDQTSDEACIMRYIREQQVILNTQISTTGKLDRQWIWAKDPLLGAKLSKMIILEDFYNLDIYIWYPDIQYSAQIICPKCKQSEKVRIKDSAPRPRMVVGLSRNYAIISKRYKCTRSGCSTFMAYDRRVLEMFPPFVQSRFPAWLTDRGALDITLVSLLRCLFNNSMGPEPVADMLRERHSVEYHRRKRDYYSYCEYAKNSSSVGKHPGYNLPPKRFSNYNDKNGYHGFTPTGTYLKGIYLEYMSHIRPFLDREVMKRGCTIAKADHSFKIPKFIAKYDGQQLFEGLYTVTNEYEEIKSQFFTITKSHDELRSSLQKLNSGLSALGHALIELIFSDSCCLDRKFFEECFPSLTNDVNHVSRLSLPPSEGELLLPDNVQHIVVNCSETMQNSIDFFNSMVSEESEKIVLFVNMLWSPEKPVTIIQISHGNYVFSYMLKNLSSYGTTLPESMYQFFNNESYVFVGIDIEMKVRKFQEKFRRVKFSNVIDLSQICYAKRMIPTSGCNLVELCRYVLRKNIGRDLSCSKWEEDKRRWIPAMENFLALSMFACGMIYEKYLETRSPLSRPVISELNENDTVGIIPKYGIQEQRIAAFGRIKRVLENHIVVDLAEVIIPNAYLPIRPPNINCITFQDVMNYEMESECTVDIKIHVKNVVTSTVNEFMHRNGNNIIQELDDHIEIRRSLANHLSTLDNLARHSDSADSQFGTFRNDELNEINVDYICSLLGPENHNHTYTRVLLDIFHAMKRFDLKRNHGLAPSFFRALRDAIFQRNDEDYNKIKDYLESIDETFEQREANNWKWIARRLRRQVPQPLKLMTSVMAVLTRFATARDANTDKPLFGKPEYEAAKMLLQHIALGCLSDPPGISLYFGIRTDETTGLTEYRCVRGTNSVEGSVHQKNVDCFGTFNASPEFADSLIAEFRHRHNERASRRNRPNYPRFNHYDTWLIDDIQLLERSLGIIDPSLSRWCNGRTFYKTSEQYGIVSLSNPGDGCEPYAENDSLKGTMKFLAKRMNTKYPVLPVHGKAEKQLFYRLSSTILTNDGRPDFKAISAIWNQRHVDGKEIFYKLTCHLENYQKINQRNSNIRNSENRLGSSHFNLRAALREPVIQDNSVGRGEAINVISQPEILIRPGTFTQAPLLPCSNSPIMNSEISMTTQTAKRQRRCGVCKSLECRGRGNRTWCSSLATSEANVENNENIVPQVQQINMTSRSVSARKRLRHCFNCRQSSCPGTNNRSRCTQLPNAN